jgi:hypothetical protein
MRFFFDRSVSWRLAHMADAFDSLHNVTAHDHEGRFNKNTTDLGGVQE